MERLIYVYIDEKNVKCYPNLRELAKDNTNTSYFSLHRLLKTTSIVIKEDYKIAVTRLKYKTKRGFNKQSKEYD